MSVADYQQTQIAAVRWRLAGLGLIMALAMVALAFTGYSAHHHGSLRWGAALLMVGVYLRGYYMVRSADSDALPTTVVIGAILALLGFSLPVFWSTDLQAYTNYGWLQHRYGLNPYTRLISDAPGWQDDPMFTRAWAPVPCVYGFLFALLTRLIAAIGGGHLELTIALFKVTSVVEFGAIAVLIRAIARRINVARVDLALYVYLWSPLIILHELADVTTIC